MAHSDKLIHSIKIDNVVYEIHDAQAIHSIEDLQLSGVLKFAGIVPGRDELPAASASLVGYVYHVRDIDSEVVCVEDNDEYRWEDFGHAIVDEHTHTITLTPSTTSASKVSNAGSVAVGSKASFTQGKFTPGSFTQGIDTYVAGKYTPGTASLTHNGGSFEQGEDSFTPNVPTAIDTSKFSGGSASFTQGTDSFTANTPTVIDTSKFSGGSASLSGGSYTAPTASLTPGSCTLTGGKTAKIDTTKFSGGSISYTAPVYTKQTVTSGKSMDASVSKGVLTLTESAITLSDGGVTAGSVTHTPASFQSGFYTAGSDASLSCTQPTLNFNAGSVTMPTLSFTAAKLNSGFYTAGKAASFTQGKDTHSFTPASLASGFYTAGSAAQFTQGQDKYTAGSATLNYKAGVYVPGSFKQGTDNYVAPTHAADSFTANTPTSVTLPTFTTVSNLWTSATVSCSGPIGIEHEG